MYIVIQPEFHCHNTPSANENIAALYPFSMPGLILKPAVCPNPRNALFLLIAWFRIRVQIKNIWNILSHRSPSIKPAGELGDERYLVLHKILL